MTIPINICAIKQAIIPQKSKSDLSRYILPAIAIIILFILFSNHKNTKYYENGEKISLDLSDIEHVVIEDDAELARARNLNCSYWDCFNVYKCGQKHQDKLSIYVYPLREYTDTKEKSAFILTKEFYRILKTIVNSKYYTSNPNEACLFIPSIDALNQELIDINLVSKILTSLPYWENGENHLLFNMIPGYAPDYNYVLDVHTDKALIAGSGFSTWTMRYGFDLSIPYYSPVLDHYKLDDSFENNENRNVLLISSQLNLIPRHIRVLQELAYDNPNAFLLLQKCSQPTQLQQNEINQVPETTKDLRCNFINGEEYEYPNVMEKGIFCIIGRSSTHLAGEPNLLEALATNCIPVIVSDNYVLPFSEILDWNLASIQIRESNLHSIMTVVKAISNDKILELQKHGRHFFTMYFESLEKIILTSLDEMNDRVFPHLSKNYIEWNMPKSEKTTQNPLFLPLIAPKAQGFTAVILTYDRIESLFTLIQKLSVVSSLQKILVIWNNQKKAPPHPTMFPKIAKPLKVIQTKTNKLSNRFFPYEEIETEAILTIDDDINMLTADELDFGYEVWREFPDRIVGFPSRTHIWNNNTNQWRYESEWTNQISMVLTGAAFHHKYWSYVYTNAMPGQIKEWVDDHMNCEDIAMNFLVANITRKPPIKVAPRKKFKCPECTNTEMLSADLNHMMERSACINRFTNIYGTMPLKTVEFRADPVLFKDNFPEKLKRFNDIGSL